MNACVPATTREADPPARGDNPFATCWTRPGAIPWCNVAGFEVSRLATAFLRSRVGQIVGPHGVGKSTLMVAIGHLLVEQGLSVHFWTLHAGRCRQPPRPKTPSGSVLLVDGAEQLTWRERLRLIRQCKREGILLLATAHSSWQLLTLPVLARLAPTLSLAKRLFAELSTQHPTLVQSADLAASYRRQRGNLRDVWFELYDLHEERSRKFL